MAPTTGLRRPVVTRPGRPLSPEQCDLLCELYRDAVDARIAREQGKLSASEVIAAESALPQMLISLTDWSQPAP